MASEARIALFSLKVVVIFRRINVSFPSDSDKTNWIADQALGQKGMPIQSGRRVRDLALMNRMIEPFSEKQNVNSIRSAMPTAKSSMRNNRE